ncbi:hypothetical protein ACFYON_24640 [Micromonospora sp. NPDC005686]|uniref:hypothetical protein n=1 Tax=unclassified Micromonospora TaxID=2617518 RepID=UPI0033B783A3
MDIESLVRSLSQPSRLVVDSSPRLVDAVEKYAKEAAAKNDAYRYGKAPSTVRIGQTVETSPAHVLHELGVATTLLATSPLAQVARHWAHVRYCATLTRHRGVLGLTQSAQSLVYHHKVTQSEQLGIGLALVVAKRVLQRQYPQWTFFAVDAEMALKAGFIDGAGAVAPSSRAQKRPDYFLVGHHSSGRRSRMKIVVLECKGTHQSPGFAYGQLARAAVQVRSLSVGGRRPPALMVASCLAGRQITSYVLDPPGDDELWDGTLDDFAGVVQRPPEDHHWRTRSATADEARTWSVTDQNVELPDTTAATPADELPPGAPEVFDVPEEQRGWFTGILTRAVAATALLFAGDSGAARNYATPRQRGESEPPDGQLRLFELDQSWARTTATSHDVTDDLRAQGTLYRTPLPNGRTLEVFRGVEIGLYGKLADGQLAAYFRAAPSVRRRWLRSRPRQRGGVVSLGRDGTVLTVRVTDRRD